MQMEITRSSKLKAGEDFTVDSNLLCLELLLPRYGNAIKLFLVCYQFILCYVIALNGITK